VERVAITVERNEAVKQETSELEQQREDLKKRIEKAKEQKVSRISPQPRSLLTDQWICTNRTHCLS
jgi:FtsZ-binding cell division protein ZapB